MYNMTGLIGGAIKKSLKSMDQVTSSFTIFVITLIILIVKTFLVKICYNKVIPKIMKDINVYRLTFTDSIFLVILFSNLI